MLTTSTVLVFLMGARTGPRRMDVRRDTSQPFCILPSRNAFPAGAAICAIHIHVGTQAFKVFFDKYTHDYDRDNALYVFVAMASSGRPINICPEDDLPSLLEAEKQCIFRRFCYSLWHSSACQAVYRLTNVTTRCNKVASHCLVLHQTLYKELCSPEISQYDDLYLCSSKTVVGGDR